MKNSDDELLEVLRQIRDELRAIREERSTSNQEYTDEMRADHAQRVAHSTNYMDEWRDDKQRWEKYRQQRDRLSAIVIFVAIGALVVGTLVIFAWRILYAN